MSTDINYHRILLSYYNLIYVCNLNDRQCYALGLFINIEKKHIYELLTGNFIQQKINL